MKLTSSDVFAGSETAARNTAIPPGPASRASGLTAELQLETSRFAALMSAANRTPYPTSAGVSSMPAMPSVARFVAAPPPARAHDAATRPPADEKDSAAHPDGMKEESRSSGPGLRHPPADAPAHTQKRSADGLDARAQKDEELAHNDGAAEPGAALPDASPTMPAAADAGLELATPEAATLMQPVMTSADLPGDEFASREVAAPGSPLTLEQQAAQSAESAESESIQAADIPGAPPRSMQMERERHTGEDKLAEIVSLERRLEEVNTPESLPLELLHSL